MSDNTGKIQDDTRFKKGRSGNPKGRPKGSKNKLTQMAECLLEEDIEEVCQTLIIQAKKGNISAAKLVLDKLLPTPKDRPIRFFIPEIASSSDLLACAHAVTRAVAEGEITPSEGEAMSRILDSHGKAWETHSLENRLIRAEEQLRGLI